MRKRSDVAVTGAAAPEHEVVEQDVKDAEQVPAEGATAPFRFDRVNPGKPADLHPGFARIVETIAIEDVEATYNALERELRVGQKRTDYTSLMKALDRAESNARKANRLWHTSRLVRDEWELNNASVVGAMRDEAVAALQREKSAGTRSKQITDADVESTAAMLYPENWSAEHMKRRRLDAMVRSLEHLAEMWGSRCRSLQAMLGKLR